MVPDWIPISVDWRYNLGTQSHYCLIIKILVIIDGILFVYLFIYYFQMKEKRQSMVHVIAGSRERCTQPLFEILVKAVSTT